jgi:hypothetical protein
MSSEQLADGVNPLDAELAATWDVLKGYSGRDTDLGIARRFGGAAAAYSLRDIGAMNGRVVKVRRDVDGDGTDKEEDFSANQVQSGALEDWVNGKLEYTLPADVATAAAAYSLRKVNSSYGIPVTEVNGTENFPATVPSSGSPADIGNGFTVNRFSDGVADSESVTVSGETITVTAIASGTGTFSAGCRIKGLSDNKQYTVSGEFRVTSQGADGDGVALVDISDATAGTDEDSITTSSTTFTPFFIDAGYNGGSTNNFVDLQANSNGSNSGTLTAEFRNVQIIENNNSAVRIRRSSDDEEVVVGFDSDNKVSASSPVTATPSGSTTATDLNGFLNESVSGFTSVPYSEINSSYKHFTSDPTISDTAFSGTNGGTQSRLTYQNPFGYLVSASDFDGCKVKVTGTVNTLSGGNITLKPNTQNDGGGSWTPSEGTKVLSTIGSFEYIFTGNGTNSFKSVVFLIDASTTVDVSNLTFEFIEHGATVHTWYDQAGSNNAVQETAANQPKIAENGALLADGLDFDGTNDRLVSSSGLSVTTSTDISFNLVGESDNITSTQTIISQKSGTGQGRSWTDIVSSNFRSSIGGSAKTFGSVGSNETQFLFTYILDESANTADGFKNSAQSGSQQTVNNAEAADGEIVIGCNNGESGQFLNGHLKEVIVYLSDQTDNRFKIESNINNYYGLYTFQGNGFVETWYDQSGNGNDATQASAGNQPTIVQNGGLNSDGVSFDGVNDYMDFNTSLNAPLWSFIAHRATKNNSAVFGVTAIYDIWLGRRSTGTYLQVVTGVLSGGSYTDSIVLRTDQIDADGAEIFSNGTSLVSGDNATSNLGSWGRLGGQGQLSSTKFLEGNIKEAVFYTTDKTSDRTEIETEINNHYNIY